MKLYTLSYIFMIFYAASSCYAEVIEIQNPQEFQEIILNNPLVIADFYASWCQPCQRMAPYFHTVSQGNNNVIFVKINHSNDALRSTIFNHYNVHSFPTLILFKNGQTTQIIHGTKTAAQLRNIVERLVAS